MSNSDSGYESLGEETKPVSAVVVKKVTKKNTSASNSQFAALDVPSDESDSDKEVKPTKASIKRDDFAKLAQDSYTAPTLSMLDDYDDADFDDNKDNVGGSKEMLHIRMQQRNGRKNLTTLSNIPKEWDAKAILKEMKKEFACNGHVVKDETIGNVIQLQGNHKSNIRDFLIKNDVEVKNIKEHGF